METDIRPEPSDAERRAILAALRELEDEPSPYSDAWGRAEVEDDQA